MRKRNTQNFGTSFNNILTAEYHFRAPWKRRTIPRRYTRTCRTTFLDQDPAAAAQALKPKEIVLALQNLSKRTSAESNIGVQPTIGRILRRRRTAGLRTSKKSSTTKLVAEHNYMTNSTEMPVSHCHLFGDNGINARSLGVPLEIVFTSSHPKKKMTFLKN